MNKLAVLLVVTLLLISGLIIVVDQRCMTARDYGRSFGCQVAGGFVAILFPQAR